MKKKNGKKMEISKNFAHSVSGHCSCGLVHNSSNTDIYNLTDEDLNMDGQELKSGEKKDEGKARWELLAYDAVEGIVKVLTIGAQKYEPRNWELGIPYGRVFAALQRHLTAYWRGESRDPESGLSHLDHALCELMFLSAYEKRGMKQFDDRPRK